MAVVCDASGERLRRTASLPASNAFTVCGWARLAANFSTYNILAVLSNSAATENHGIGYLSDAGYGWTVFNAVDVPSNPFSTTPVANEWFFWCLKADGSNITGHYARVQDASLDTKTATYRALTPFSVVVGNAESDTALHFNGRIAAVKIWDAALTEAEVAQERWSVRPRRLANLHLWSPLLVNSLDYSGAGKNWTEGGTLTWADGPPVGWGASPLIGGGTGGVEAGPDYGTPRDHSGVKPFSSLWRPARA